MTQSDILIAGILKRYSFLLDFPYFCAFFLADIIFKVILAIHSSLLLFYNSCQIQLFAVVNIYCAPYS